jgi:mannose/fructose/N-acetylgalactosamine-specific phosphotransferase system component IID
MFTLAELEKRAVHRVAVQPTGTFILEPKEQRQQTKVPKAVLVFGRVVVTKTPLEVAVVEAVAQDKTAQMLEVQPQQAQATVATV